MAWIESHQSLARHRKTLRATSLLGCDRHKLIGHLHELWWWAIDNVPSDGALRGLSDMEIAAGADWGGDAEEFVAALVTAGFIERRDGALALHDWHDYAGKLSDRREAERERSKQRRQPPLNGRPTAGQPPDDQQTTVGTVPNSTGPDRTGPDRTGDEAASAAKPPQNNARGSEIDDEFIALIISEYGPRLGGERRARDSIDAAMNHKALDKAKSKKQYLRTWLNRDADRMQERTNGRTHTAIPGFNDYEGAAEAMAAIDRRLGNLG